MIYELSNERIMGVKWVTGTATREPSDKRIPSRILSVLLPSRMGKAASRIVLDSHKFERER